MRHHVRFKNRKQAGDLLATQLKEFREKFKLSEIPLVVALPRGGVVVANRIAKALETSLEVLVVRKIGAPSQPELGVGAITEEGQYWVDSDLCSRLSISPEDLQRTLSTKALEVLVWREKFGPFLCSVKGKTVLLVDDGAATGVSAVVGAEYLRSKGASRIFFAAPVAPSNIESRIGGHFDGVLIYRFEDDFSAVGEFYEQFNSVTLDEAVSYLRNGAEVKIPIEGGFLKGVYTRMPVKNDLGVVVFVHGSGSSRLSPRNRKVSDALNAAGYSTLIFDLLTEGEENDRNLVFDIPLLSNRLQSALEWVRKERANAPSSIYLFGASTGAAAALVAATGNPRVKSVLCRGGRPDLAGKLLRKLHIPVLMIVGGNDSFTLEVNRQSLTHLSCSSLEVVPRATHLFEEPGALEKVIEITLRWLSKFSAETKRRTAA